MPFYFSIYFDQKKTSQSVFHCDILEARLPTRQGLFSEGFHFRMCHWKYSSRNWKEKELSILLELLWVFFFLFPVGFCCSRKASEVRGRSQHTMPAGPARAHGAGSVTERRASPQGCRAKSCKALRPNGRREAGI